MHFSYIINFFKHLQFTKHQGTFEDNFVTDFLRIFSTIVLLIIVY